MIISNHIYLSADFTKNRNMEISYRHNFMGNIIISSCYDVMMLKDIFPMQITYKILQRIVYLTRYYIYFRSSESKNMKHISSYMVF